MESQSLPHPGPIGVSCMLLEAAQLLHGTLTNRFLVLCDFCELPEITCCRFLFCGRGSVRLCYLAGPCLERLWLQQGEWSGRDFCGLEGGVLHK